MVALGLQALALLFLAGFTQGQQFTRNPVIVDYSVVNKKFIEEGLEIGTRIGKVEAYDPEGQPLNFRISGEAYSILFIDPNTGDVFIKNDIDFDNLQTQQLDLTLFVRAGRRQTQEDGSVIITDKNDNRPEFRNKAPTYTISEAARPGTVVGEIVVTDRDVNNINLVLTCNRTTRLLRDACNTFGLNRETFSNQGWSGTLDLLRPVDYETRNSYVLKVAVFDGVFNITNQITVNLEDVNDSPPIWEKTGPKVIDEEEPVGTPIQTVTATDRDKTDPRRIYYELMSFTDIFQINSSTGVISNALRLDYDAPDSPRNTPYDVKIKAREVIPQPDGSTQLGNDPFTTATVDIKITLRDINDNRPLFYRGDEIVTEYEVFIDENVINDQNVPALQMTVADNDQTAIFNTFSLTTRNFTDIFGIIPNEESSSSSPSIYVKDASRIDFESRERQYRIQVIAQESRTRPAFTSTATVIINVRDVNDETPVFDRQAYYVNVSELATGGEVLVRLNAEDPEEGIFGKAGIRYKLLGDTNHFEIDPETGVLTVKACATPGRDPCINFERVPKYDLIVDAVDAEGDPDRGNRGTAFVFIQVLDENDNRPLLDTEYVRYIREMEQVTINPLVIEAIDPDTVGGPVVYSLSGSDAALWKIDLINVDGSQRANITAIRPILAEDAFKPGAIADEFNFTLVARDQQFSEAAKIIIKVIDSNNYAPYFEPAVYRETLDEGTPGEVFLTRVRARDLDSPTTGNGIIDFVISGGSVGKFQLRNRGNESDGEYFYIDVYTTPDADFDYNVKNQYNLTLECRDRGTPQALTGTGSVLIVISDTNNVNPVIRPTSTTINVREDTPIGRSVHQISANDPDVDRVLRYFMTPQTATQPNGALASVDFRDLFRVNRLTGEVTVNGILNRDDVAFINNELRVEDQGANPVQVGFGGLFIRITEYNDQDPEFSQPLYNISLKEELQRTSFVTNLECTDEDDRIAGYTLTQVSPRYPQLLTLLPDTGIVVVNERIDYEQVELITLTAVCVDTGQNQRSATSSIIVNVINLNDNAPIFKQEFYETTAREGTYTEETPLLQVSATDLDKGDYGVVRYRLRAEDENRFRIDPISGQIYLIPGATFDRESSLPYDIMAYAYDSPNNPNERRETPVSIYITVEDINDNCPEFTLDIYTGVIPESAEPGTNIIDILASDKDIGINGQLRFAIQPNSGDPPGAERLFLIESREDHGRLLTQVSLRNRVGIKRFNVTVTDMNGMNSPDACTVSVPVEIDVKESQNDAPEWVKPPNREFVIYVLESQYRGMLVYDTKAKDANEGPNGVVDYFFSVERDFVPATPEFRINQVTGVIRAEVVFDREQRSTYFLTLMARDRGNPAASSETTLTVVILDVDDNDPRFPMKNGAVVPLVLPSEGNGPVIDGAAIPPGGKLLGNCSHLATDLDSDVKNNRIYYRLLSKGNGIEDYIEVTRDNCQIFLRRPVDFEVFPNLEFDILAFNEKNDDSVKRYNKREVNPSILPVIVNIQDTNDHAPEFTKPTYLACASVDAPYRAPILQVSATDKDQGDNDLIWYSLATNPTFITNSFNIDENLGMINNKISFRYGGDGRRQYEMNVVASDARGQSRQTAVATAIVFITDGSNLVRIKVNQPRIDVEPFKQQLVNTIKAKSKGRIDFACIESIANHETEDGEETTEATDVYLLGASRSGNRYSIIPASELSGIIGEMMNDGEDSLNAVYVTRVEEKGESDEFELTEDAILAIFIVCILLIFLAIILACLACYCIRNSKRKKVKKLKAERHTVVQVAHEPVETSFNPVYSSGPETTEYATVKKTAPITPVVIPAPQDLQPVPTEQPANLQPVEPPAPEEPEPVIETEVLPDPVPVHDVRPAPLEHPEYEDRIETTIVDDEPAPPPPPEDQEPPSSLEPSPVPVYDGEIEVEIKESLPASPASSKKGSN